MLFIILAAVCACVYFSPSTTVGLLADVIVTMQLNVRGIKNVTGFKHALAKPLRYYTIGRSTRGFSAERYTVCDLRLTDKDNACWEVREWPIERTLPRVSVMDVYYNPSCKTEVISVSEFQRHWSNYANFNDRPDKEKLRKTVCELSLGGMAIFLLVGSIQVCFSNLANLARRSVEDHDTESSSGSSGTD